MKSINALLALPDDLTTNNYWLTFNEPLLDEPLTNRKSPIEFDKTISSFKFSEAFSIEICAVFQIINYDAGHENYSCEC